MSSTDLKGYPKEICRIALENRWICTVCSGILRNAFQSSEGLLFCQGCIPSSEINSGDYNPDRAIDKEILKLPVNCENVEFGCNWTGELGELQEHLEKNCSCPQSKSPTLNSRKKSPGKKNRKPKKGKPAAPQKFAEKGSNEPNNCAISNDQCEFYSIGCPEKDLNDERKKNHMESNITTHLELIYRKIVGIEKHVESAFRDTEEFESSIHQKITELALKCINDVVTDIKTSIAELVITLKEKEGKIRKCQADVLGIKQKQDDFIISNQLMKESLKKIQEAEDHTLASELLQKESNALTEELRAKVLSNDDSVKSLQENIEDLFCSLRDLQTSRPSLNGQDLVTEGNVVITQSPCMTPDLPAIIYPPPGSEDFTISYDGSLLWKIPKVSDMSANAVRGKTRSFYSPPFFTGYRGYKLCGRLFLNGDGMGKDSHISLFISILRGPYDALLPWPLHGKIRLVLIDQENLEHYTEDFVPDPNSRCFHRPVTVVNKSSGSPMFFPLAKLTERGFIKEDTMFIKITVETNSLW